jgi:hypothetical protein
MSFNKSKVADRDPDRLAIARHLDENGPTAGDELAGAVGLSPERFWALVNCPWFEITGRGWDLTDQGRDEAIGEK